MASQCDVTPYYSTRMAIPTLRLPHPFPGSQANPELAAANKAASDAKRERRAAAGTSKTFK